MNFNFVSFLFDLHSTHDFGRLSFDTVADILHVEDRNHQVHVEPQLITVPLSEQFNMGGQEILGKKKTH